MDKVSIQSGDRQGHRRIAPDQRFFTSPVEVDGVLRQIRSLHRNVDVHFEGLFYRDRLVSVMCEDGLCCAFSMDNRCNVGRGVSPEDGRQLALNLAIYAMTH